jgi:tellurite resistance protein
MQYSQELVEDLALVYLVFTGYTKGKLNAPEIEAMEKILNVWTDGFMTEELKDLIPYTQRKVAEAHRHGLAHRRLLDALDSLHDRLHPSKLKIVLFDLLALANLDGVIEPREREFIDRVASRWGFKLSDTAYQKAA